MPAQPLAQPLTPIRPPARSPLGRWPSAAAWVVWLCLGLLLAYWALRLWGFAGLSLAPVGADAGPATDSAAVARALGAGAAVAAAEGEAPADSKLNLLGWASQGREGAALIAVDGQAARPFRIGQAVRPGLYLLALDGKRVHLGPSPSGPRTLRLSLPEPQPGPALDSPASAFPVAVPSGLVASGRPVNSAAANGGYEAAPSADGGDGSDANPPGGDPTQPSALKSLLRRSAEEANGQALVPSAVP